MNAFSSSSYGGHATPKSRLEDLKRGAVAPRYQTEGSAQVSAASLLTTATAAAVVVVVVVVLFFINTWIHLLLCFVLPDMRNPVLLRVVWFPERCCRFPVRVPRMA